ncbi:hypothetical protein BDF22DRAFT_723 [Syncephalis plumigaleata]|nr:hypothetical protein BDF22DRAFT_723 [Syncephalis plumigaleata]
MLLASSIAHVTWRQRRTTRYNEEKQLFLPTSPNTASTEEEKPFVACILPISQFITKTSSSTDVNELMKLIHRSYAKYKPILIIHGFTAYLRKRDTIWHRWYAERVRNNGQSAREEPSEEELGPDQQEVERRLIDIQLRHRCLMLMIDQWSELARWISQYCGEMSIHSQRSVQSMAHGLPRVPTGKTASDTWRIMLEQVYSCSASAAMAISQRYPTPYALYTAYNACTSSQDAEQMLASLMVNYGPIGAQHARRLGPTLSRRIYRVFCSVNPDEIIS